MSLPCRRICSGHSILIEHTNTIATTPICVFCVSTQRLVSTPWNVHLGSTLDVCNSIHHGKGSNADNIISTGVAVTFTTLTHKSSDLKLLNVSDIKFLPTLSC